MHGVDTAVLILCWMWTFSLGIFVFACSKLLLFASSFSAEYHSSPLDPFRTAVPKATHSTSK